MPVRSDPNLVRLLGALASCPRVLPSGPPGGLCGALGRRANLTRRSRPLRLRDRSSGAVSLDPEGVETSRRDPEQVAASVVETAPEHAERRVRLRGRLDGLLLDQPRESSATATLVAAPPRREPGSGSRLPSARCAAAVSRVAWASESFGIGFLRFGQDQGPSRRCYDREPGDRELAVPKDHAGELREAKQNKRLHRRSERAPAGTRTRAGPTSVRRTLR
jgi:hypothetical protein